MARFIWRSLWISGKSNLLLHGASVLTMFLCMGLMIFGFSVATSLRVWLTNLDSEVRLLVQVHKGHEGDLLVRVQQLPGVAAARLLTREEVTDSIGRGLGISAPAALTQLDLPAMIRVTPAATVASPAVLADQIGQLAGVDGVEYGQRWLQRFHDAANTVLRGSVLITLFLVGAGFLILMTVYTLILYSRRRELEIMDMVGAAPGHIYLPVIIEGMAQALLGSLLAVLVVRLLLGMAGERLTIFGAGLEIQMGSSVGFILFGLLVGGSASMVAMLQSLRQMPEDS